VWRRNWTRITPFFQLPAGHPQGDLHHQQRGIAKSGRGRKIIKTARIPTRGCAEVTVSCLRQAAKK